MTAMKDVVSALKIFNVNACLTNQRELEGLLTSYIAEQVEEKVKARLEFLNQPCTEL